MKKVLSVFELLVRNTIYKVLMVLVAAGVVEIVSFWNRMLEQLALQSQPAGAGVGGNSLELIVESSNQYGWYTVTFVLITAILGFSTCNFGSVQSYTLKRLRVSEWELFWIQSIYNFLCYVLLMGVQLGFLLIMGYLYVTHNMDATNQTLFLAFYRNDFMHSILPMEEWLRLFINFILYAGMAVTAASVPYFSRNKKIIWEAVAVMGILAVGFEAELGDHVPYSLALIVVSVAILAVRRVYLHCMEPIRVSWVDNVVTQEKINQ